MINDSMIIQSNSSFLKRQLFKLKINAALKVCGEIMERVKASHKIGREDFAVNIVVADPELETFEERYFAVKGYAEDGSLRPLQFYTIEEGELINIESFERNNIIVLDLYEKSIFLHNYRIEGDNLEGYLVKKETFKNGCNVILAAEKVNVYMKNTNTYEEYKNLFDFVDKYLL